MSRGRVDFTSIKNSQYPIAKEKFDRGMRQDPWKGRIKVMVIEKWSGNFG